MLQHRRRSSSRSSVGMVGRVRWFTACRPAGPKQCSNALCLLQHGGIYVKRSAKFKEKEMRQKLLSYVSAGTPVSDAPALGARVRDLMRLKSRLRSVVPCEMSMQGTEALHTEPAPGP